MSSFTDYLAIAAQLISVFVGLVTIGLAIYGLFSWKRLRKRQLGEEVLALLYQARDVIRYMRNSYLAAPYEFENLKQQDNESDVAYSIRYESSIPELRYMHNKNIFAKINSLKYRCKVIYGERSDILFSELKNIIDEISIAVDEYRRLKEAQIGRDDDQYSARIFKHKKTFQSQDKNDEINKRLNKLIEAAEGICK